MIVARRGLDKFLPDDHMVSHHQVHFKDASHISYLRAESVHLVLTSPPYWRIKDYGGADQIGYNDTLGEYRRKLLGVWENCVRVLKAGCKLVINIGDMFFPTTPTQRYHIVPLHAHLIEDITTTFPDTMTYLGTINWRKVTTSRTSGGGKVMGCYPYPRNGLFFVNQEFILIFRKNGDDPRPSPAVKEQSKLSSAEWREYFKDVWTFPGARQDQHGAVFPEELPKRIIRMYTFVGDTVLDPFIGSGTMTKVAAEWARNSIGFEIGFQTRDGVDWRKVVQQKIQSATKGTPFKVDFITS